MAVTLILLNDVADLGKIGDQVNVSDGYARNYLLPNKLAAKATPGILKQIAAKKAALEKERASRVAAAQEIAAQLAKIAVTIAVATGENDKLYGAVTATQILDAVKAQGVELERNSLVLAEPIRELGEKEVEVKLDADVKGIIKVNVVRQNA